MWYNLPVESCVHTRPSKALRSVAPAPCRRFYFRAGNTPETCVTVFTGNRRGAACCAPCPQDRPIQELFVLRGFSHYINLSREGASALEVNPFTASPAANHTSPLLSARWNP